LFFRQELIVLVQLTSGMPMLAALTDPARSPSSLQTWAHAMTAGDTPAMPAHWPAQGDILEWCRVAGPGLAVVLILAGIVFLLFGYSIFKVLVTLNAAILGGYVGAMLGDKSGVAVPAGIVGAMLSGTAAWPTMKYSVAIMGGLFGMVLGVTFWRLANLNPDFGWSGGMTGLVFFGLLSFLLFRECIMTYTSLQGSVMLVFGILGLLLKYQDVADPLNHHFQLKPFLLPLAIFIPTLGGFIYQRATISGPAPAAPAKK
jgi:hypothetical protein